MNLVPDPTRLAFLFVGFVAACNTDTPMEHNTWAGSPAGERPAFSVTSTDTLVSVADAYVRAFAPNKNYGGDDSLPLRSFTNNPDNRYNVYIRFDQTAIASQVGTQQLDSARLEFYLKDGGGWPAAGDWINVYRIPSSWAPNGWTEAGVTNNCPNDTNTSNAALNCPGAVWDTTGFGAMSPTSQFRLNNDTRGWISFNVTADVSAFLADTVNRGWYVTKQNNNNNERIVFWSRESSLAPHLVLFVTQDSSFKLLKTVEAGVQGTLSHSDSLVPAGTTVSYSFVPASGYENAQVVLDGEVVPATGSFVMSKDRVFIASADRVVTVPAADQSLLQAARAVIESSDPVASYQTYLNGVVALFASTTAEDASHRLDAVEFLAYDPIEDSTALGEAEAALTNHVFTLGDTARADTTAEATTFVFINGIKNSYGNASQAAVLVNILRQEVTLFQRPAFEVKFFYNRTFAVQAGESQEDKEASCAAMYDRRREFLGYASQLLFMQRCVMLANAVEWDLVEAFHQVLSVKMKSSATAFDARVLADSLQLWRARGRHVLAIPHSQGNLMMQQGLTDLRNVYGYSESNDSTCVGVMSLAAPVSSGWGSLPEFRLKGMVLQGDLVADQSFNSFPRTSNALSTRLNARLDSLHEITEGYYFDWADASRDSIHMAYTYLVPSETRTVIQNDLKELYGTCVPAFVSLNTAGQGHPVGEVWQATADVRNSDFEQLNGRRIAWSTSNASVASVDSMGTIHALAVGNATITGRSDTARGQVSLSIHPASPFPPGVSVFGEWHRTRPDGNGGECEETLIIDASASLDGDCDDGSNPDLNFGVSVTAPYISGKLAPSGGTSERWNIALVDDGNTLTAIFTRFPNDPDPVTMVPFTRAGAT